MFALGYDETEGIAFWGEKAGVDGEQGLLFVGAIACGEILAAGAVRLIDGFQGMRSGIKSHALELDVRKSFANNFRWGNGVGRNCGSADFRLGNRMGERGGRRWVSGDISLWNGCAGWNACSEDEGEPEFGSGVHGVRMVNSEE